MTRFYSSHSVGYDFTSISQLMCEIAKKTWRFHSGMSYIYRGIYHNMYCEYSVRVFLLFSVISHLFFQSIFSSIPSTLRGKNCCEADISRLIYEEFTVEKLSCQGSQQHNEKLKGNTIYILPRIRYWGNRRNVYGEIFLS